MSRALRLSCSALERGESKWDEVRGMPTGRRSWGSSPGERGVDDDRARVCAGGWSVMDGPRIEPDESEVKGGEAIFLEEDPLGDLGGRLRREAGRGRSTAW